MCTMSLSLTFLCLSPTIWLPSPAICLFCTASLSPRLHYQCPVSVLTDSLVSLTSGCSTRPSSTWSLWQSSEKAAFTCAQKHPMTPSTQHTHTLTFAGSCCSHSSSAKLYSLSQASLTAYTQPCVLALVSAQSPPLISPACLVFSASPELL